MRNVGEEEVLAAPLRAGELRLSSVPSGGSKVFDVVCAGPAFATGVARRRGSSARRKASISGNSGTTVPGCRWRDKSRPYMLDA